jgi:hypothetical protein
MLLLGIPDRLPVMVPSAQSAKNGAKTIVQRPRHITAVKLTPQQLLFQIPNEKKSMSVDIVHSPTMAK